MSKVQEQLAGDVPKSPPSITTASMYGDNNPETAPPAEPAPTHRPTLRKRLSELGARLNRAAHQVGAEGFFPTPLPVETDKAARILHGFASPSASSPPPPTTASAAPKHPLGLTQKLPPKIPLSVLSQAKGLAVFNTLRLSALHGSLACGSGLVVARRPDGSWSPPSAFVVTTLGAGFSVGLDAYDVVCVLTTDAHVRAFTRPRVSLGGELGASLGPAGAGVNVGTALAKASPVPPVWSYIRSRGLWVGAQVDGTVMVGRAEANEAFYGRKVTAAEILCGDVQWPAEGGEALRGVLAGLDAQVQSVPPPAEPVTSPAAPDIPVSEVNQAAVVPYRDEPRETNEEAQPPAYGSEHQDVKENETALEEKERLAKSGY